MCNFLRNGKFHSPDSMSSTNPNNFEGVNKRSATNRVKDLKAKLLGRQSKLDSSPDGTPRNSGPTKAQTEASDSRVNGVTSQMTSSKSSTNNPAQQDIVVNSALNTKFDLAEDRALSSLVRCVMQYVFGGSGDLESIERAMELYNVRELSNAMVLGGMLEGALQSIESFSMSLEQSNEELVARFPEFMQLLSQASTSKRRRFEYNESSKTVLTVQSKDESSRKLDEMAKLISSLKESNIRLARTIEYRQKQLEPLLYWAKVLETGRLE